MQFAARVASGSVTTTQNTVAGLAEMGRKVRVVGCVNFLQYCMTTGMQEDHIVFGGEKRMAEAIREAYALLKPKAISVYSTCPVGLIGDDIHSVCRQSNEELSINVLGEYNIGGDAWEIDTLLRKCGISVLATLSGGVTYDEIASCHQADLNVVMCHRSINYMAPKM